MCRKQSFASVVKRISHWAVKVPLLVCQLLLPPLGKVFLDLLGLLLLALQVGLGILPFVNDRVPLKSECTGRAVR